MVLVKSTDKLLNYLIFEQTLVELKMENSQTLHLAQVFTVDVMDSLLRNTHEKQVQWVEG